jgi:cytochrome c oxidase cbb3-type subunit II
MNNGLIIFLGIFGALALSWYGMIVTPQMQIGGQEPVMVEQIGSRYPVPRPGLAWEGREIYRANGCYYCHTQQVRPPGFGGDTERGWGIRQTVAQDFLYETPLMLGSRRLGPDLANIGLRQPDVLWHLMRLYDPQVVAPRSTMPAYPYLFEKRPIGKAPSPNALPLDGAHAPEAGYEIVPRREAHALVAYLLSLKADVPLFEAPHPPSPEEEEEDSESPENASGENAQASL